ncbi:uncharacterized protein LOC130445778 [Diorhabda sublineata]|uniref:uncharacterized protein LOC130445778 n=1 Tax=Diorhabda sublineata TaxID=1163346 RepID=UPI0024E0FC12|nr:uncharacterized protein LOC130445778 [Diorhabda sublineata]
MFTFSEPLERQWSLRYGEKHISINKDIAAKLQNPDVIAINFLYQSYCNKFGGCILNEEDGFKTQLQVSVFINILKQILSAKDHIYILVITPGYLREKWHNKIENIGGYKVKILDSTACPSDFDQETALVLLVSFEDIKLVETLVPNHLSCVIIDHFDIVATKMVIKKVDGDFNIGITRRNFYVNPDQKLQWTMLNWTNSTFLGRLVDYYEVDNDNFANLRDNYHHWWLTLTWDYCESFKRNLDDEDDESQPLQLIKKTKRIYKKTKQRSSSYATEEENTSKNKEEIIQKYGETAVINHLDSRTIEIIRTIENNVSNVHNNAEINNIKMNDSDSEDTIEYKPQDLDSSKTKMLYDTDNVLLGIIEGTSSQTSFDKLDHDSQVNFKKDELYSQLFSDNPLPDTETNNSTRDSSEQYLLSLI